MSKEQYRKFLDAEEEKQQNVENVNRNSQKSLNDRLAGCYIRFLTAEEFDAKAGEHYAEQISLVLRDDAIELWKGDIRIYLGPAGDESIQLIVQNL